MKKKTVKGYIVLYDKYPVEVFLRHADAVQNIKLLGRAKTELDKVIKCEITYSLS